MCGRYGNQGGSPMKIWVNTADDASALRASASSRIRSPAYFQSNEPAWDD